MILRHLALGLSLQLLRGFDDPENRQMMKILRSLQKAEPASLKSDEETV